MTIAHVSAAASGPPPPEGRAASATGGRRAHGEATAHRIGREGLDGEHPGLPGDAPQGRPIRPGEEGDDDGSAGADRLADRPGRTYAGALTITESNPQQDFRIDCAATPDNAALLDNVRAWAARTGAKPPLPEEEGGPFDAWF